MTIIPAKSSTFCPEEIRAANRKRELQAIWNSKEWEERKLVFLHGKSCQWCGSTTDLVPHHPDESLYKSREKYFDLSRCIVLCKRCHFALHHGRILCPNCHERYMPVGRDCCWNCLPDDERERIEIKKVMFKKRQRELRK